MNVMTNSKSLGIVLSRKAMPVASKGYFQDVTGWLGLVYGLKTVRFKNCEV